MSASPALISGDKEDGPPFTILTVLIMPVITKPWGNGAMKMHNRPRWPHVRRWAFAVIALASIIASWTLAGVIITWRRKVPLEDHKTIQDATISAKALRLMFVMDALLLVAILATLIFDLTVAVCAITVPNFWIYMFFAVYTTWKRNLPLSQPITSQELAGVSKKMMVVNGLTTANGVFFNVAIWYFMRPINPSRTRSNRARAISIVSPNPATMEDGAVEVAVRGRIEDGRS
ncbi:hypothetical protein CVT26_013968 [Gymnopilus dilepis]|uniref:Uncharacterized protein n=1 Tax=Gymnopilus dilepis TaxID=231916 RepID=A0A409WDX6_9AGAR|nr:hypothetical protein CVT26_013968 [Gymnopilus dilepis]